MPGASTVETDVCILGAGPHGLATAIHLREADPDLDVTVLDHGDRWLATWHSQFARAGIETLRSPIVHHPSPDPGALMRFVDTYDLPRSGLPYDVPTTEAFATFCQALIDDGDLDPPHPTQPHSISSLGGEVELDVGARVIAARNVVVATNPHRRNIPDWTWPLVGHRPGLVEHGLDVDLRTLPDLRGEHVAIIGGGLTAAHLAVGAAVRGAVVHLVTRRPIQVQSFDTDPGWLGPKYLRDFFAEADPTRRLEKAKRGRPGGSIPRWMYDTIGAHTEDGAVHLHESTEVRSGEVHTSGGCRLHLDDEAAVAVDRVWLATGTQPDIGSLRSLRPLLADVPTLRGLPIVDGRLRLGPHPVFVTGRLATLELGPAAGNLWGAQRAARRITEAITGIDLDYETIATIPLSIDRS